MKLAKKVLTGALSSAVFFQFMPMAGAVKDVPKLTVTRAGAAQSEPLGPYTTASFRLQIIGILNSAKDCVSLMESIDFEKEYDEGASNRMFEGICSAFNSIYESVFKPVLGCSEECYGSESLGLKRRNFVPDFLRDTGMSMEEKLETLEKFGRSLETKLRKNRLIPRNMEQYAETNPNFFRDTQNSVAYSMGIIDELRSELDLVVNGDESGSESEGIASDSDSAKEQTQGATALDKEAEGSEKSDSQYDDEDDDMLSSGSSSQSESEDDAGVVSAAKDPQVTVLAEGSVDPEDGSAGNPQGSDAHENAEEGSSSEAGENNDSEVQDTTEAKKDNFMVRFLRFISFGLLFRNKK